MIFGRVDVLIFLVHNGSWFKKDFMVVSLSCLAASMIALNPLFVVAFTF